jgi:hypothetical protein
MPFEEDSGFATAPARADLLSETVSPAVDSAPSDASDRYKLRSESRF